MAEGTRSKQTNTAHMEEGLRNTEFKETLAEGLRNNDLRVQELTNSHHQLQKSVEAMGGKLSHLQSTMERLVTEFQRNSKGKGVASGSEKVEKSQQEIGLGFLEQLRSREQEIQQELTALEIRKIELKHDEYIMNYFMYHRQSQSISVAAYENSFMEIKRWAEIRNEEFFDENWVVGVFVTGLKEEIKNYMKLWSPKSLQSAVILAKWQELCIEDQLVDKMPEPDITSNREQTIEIEPIDDNLEKSAAISLAARGTPDCISLVKKSFEGKDALSYANILRSRNKFVDALAIYKSVVEKDGGNIEAYDASVVGVHVTIMGNPFEMLFGQKQQVFSGLHNYLHKEKGLLQQMTCNWDGLYSWQWLLVSDEVTFVFDPGGLWWNIYHPICFLQSLRTRILSRAGHCYEFRYKPRVMNCMEEYKSTRSPNGRWGVEEVKYN